MEDRILADWLKSDFEIVKGEVRPKTHYEYIINEKKYDIDDFGIWVQTFNQKKEGKSTNLIIRAIPCLTHPYCLTLANLHKDIVKLNTSTRTVHKWPSEENNYHGYMTIVNVDGVFADGEVHRETLNRTMLSFANTMMQKRAEDRLILRALGLYMIGFYSKEEFGGDNEPEESTVNTISQEEKDRAKKSNQIKQSSVIFNQIKEIRSSFEPRTFISSLLNVGSDDESMNALTILDYEKILDSASKELARLRRS